MRNDHYWKIWQRNIISDKLKFCCGTFFGPTLYFLPFVLFDTCIFVVIVFFYVDNFIELTELCKHDLIL